ncbi:MAG: glycoside hydrolase family 31 protein [Bacteroidota bacterium]
MSDKFRSQLSQSLGKLIHWNTEPFGLSGETTHGKFRIQVYNDSLVRISITRFEAFDDFSYAVITSPANIAVETEDSANTLRLKTSQLVLQIQKNPVRFSFQTHEGLVINEDDPAFGTSWNGEQVTTYKKLQPEERFVGLGEKTGPLDRRGAGYVNWNTDNFGYSSGSDPLYCTTPFYIGIHNRLTYGIFFDNSHKTFFNFGASNDRFSSFAADTGEMNYYFIYGNTVAEIIQHYTHLTGRMELPPRWSIGYQQCRYSYYPDTEVLNVARTFRDKDIPADAIVLDIHYMDKYKIFTWSQKDFSDPKKMLEQLNALGFQIVVMCDPGIKVEPGYHTFEKGIRDDVFIKYPDGTNYTGQVWPGWCHFPDFTAPKTRAWWKEQFKEYVDFGVQGFWNDMNEIATWGNMLPENIELNFEGYKGTMRRGRNIYGLLMARSTYEGTKALMKGKRPFNLTRSGYSGIQRYAAVWTGDNVAYDEHMMLGIRMVNSMGLAGIAFAGYDVGGFVGNADSKLFARWVSLGAFSPFFRGHSMINSRDSEPWSYGEEVEQISRNYIKFRYQLMPYVYSLFYEASQNGMPIQRSLAIDYPHDPKIYDTQFHHQYLFGPSLLVAPVESNKQFVKVYLPEGDWYYLYDGKKYSGHSEIIVECPPQKLPVFVKAGSVLPMQLAKASTRETNDQLSIHLYQGNSNTSFVYFNDDGSSYDYQQGAFDKRVMEYRSGEKKLIVHKNDGQYRSPVKKLKLVLHGFDHRLEVIAINNTKHRLEKQMNRFFDALEKFDPIHDPEPAPEENVLTISTDYRSEEIVFQW